MANKTKKVKTVISLIQEGVCVEFSPHLLESLSRLLTRSLHSELSAKDVAELSTISITTT